MASRGRPSPLRPLPFFVPMRRLHVLIAVLVAVLASGCDSTQDEFVALPVVSATLEAGQPLPPIRLTRLALLNSTFNPATAAIRDGQVEVALVGADGRDERVVPYVHEVDGGYVATVDTAVVIPGRTYRLRAIVPSPDGLARDTLRATTVVPPTITVVEPPPDEVTYGFGTGPEVRITTSSSATRRAVYVLSATGLQRDEFEEVTIDGERRFRARNLPDRFGPVPLVVTFAGCDPDDIGRLVCDEDPGQGGRSPLLNEDNYEILGDGTARVAIPFIAFAFYGPQRVSFYSLDDALVDFVSTQTIQSNPTTISPGEVPNVTTNVENGLGVFGSLSRATVETFVRQPGT